MMLMLLSIWINTKYFYFYLGLLVVFVLNPVDFLEEIADTVHLEKIYRGNVRFT